MLSRTHRGTLLPKGSRLAFIYESTIDPDAENSCHATTLAFVGFNKRVLEVGCATGYFTKALTERGCDVVGIEIDADAAAVAEKWAERVIVGNLDSAAVWEELDGEQFDAVTFGDVLEHLRDPVAVLRSAVRLLKPSGVVAISLPNVAHGDVRMALLQGRFPYSDTGLLDRTHLRFFTRDTVKDLVRDAGLILVETRRIVKPLFQTELGVTRHSVPLATVNAILEDPDAETYQFAVKAVRDDGNAATAALAARVIELSDRAYDEVVRAALGRIQAGNGEKELRALRGQVEIHRRSAAEAHDQLQAAQHAAAVAQQQLNAVLQTKAFRLLSPLRRLYGRLR